VIDEAAVRPWLDEARQAEDAERVATVDWEDLIVGRNVRLDDPTETYHEASRLYPGLVDSNVSGAQLLERSAELRVTVTRSVKRHAGAAVVDLPPVELPGTSLAELLVRRRSIRSFGARELQLDELSALLHAAYGITGSHPGSGQHVRTVPSGGALFPLELYVASVRVAGLEHALYHYDPLRGVLEQLRALDFAEEVEPLTPYPELVGASAAVVLVTAMFWRSRFKYGQRAYRFTLLEAGHVMQNALLTATALDLAAVPIGGFYDRLADGLIGADGLAEAVVYLLPVGGAG
jgi:SagB-type dehydrogenase family enzyme